VVETDFDDLLDDAPRLGALGGDDVDDAEDDFFFDAEPDRDPIEAFAPDDDVAAIDEPATRRTRTRTRTRPPAGEDDDFFGGPPVDSGGVGGDRNLGLAVGVGVALVALGLLCFKLGGVATTVLACVVVGGAAFEYFRIVETRGYQPAGLLGLVSTIGLMIATYTSGMTAYTVVLPLTVVLGLLWYLWVQPGEESVRNLGVTLLGVMWIGVLGSFATLFLGLGKVIEDAGASSNIGIGVIIAAVVVAVSHDIGAYFIGRFYGRTPLSAASPNKTLEGTAGGVAVAVVVTVVVVGLFDIAPIGGDIFRVFVFALLCAVVAPIGDLCESFVKRDLGIKDFGSVLPGHGGVMDRFDALLFVLPTAYFVTLLFDIWG
jgi:phosphatidate cytidylyltransferase